jgi:N-acyl-L-homoserine lactone synthetase
MQYSNYVEPGEETLTIADKLASGIVDSAYPIIFNVAQNNLEREAVYRLRYEVVVDRGWKLPDELPDGMESDHYDSKAIHVVGWDGNTLAATSRLVLPELGAILPTEEGFHLQVEPSGRVADIGRQIVARNYSSIRHKVFAALLAKTWLEMRAHGYSLVCGDFSPTVMRLYRMMGFNITQLGPAQKFWGDERAPILVDIAASVSVLVDRWGKENPSL